MARMPVAGVVAGVGGAVALVLAGCSSQGEAGSAANAVTTTTTATSTVPGESIPAAEAPKMFQARDYWPEIEGAAAECSPVATPDRLDRYIWATSGWTVRPAESERAGADAPTSSTPAAGQDPTSSPAPRAGWAGLAPMPEAEWNVYGHDGDPNDPKDVIAAVGRQVCDIQNRLADIAAHDELEVHGSLPDLPGEDPKLTVATYSAVERGLNNVLGGMGADADSEFVRKVLYLR